MQHLAAIKTSSSSYKKEETDGGFDDLDCSSSRGGGGEGGEREEPPQAPSFAVSPSFALLAAQTPRAAFDVPATAESLPSDVLWRLATLLPVRDLPAAMAVCGSWRHGFGAAIDALAPSSLSLPDGGPAAGGGGPSASFLPRRFPCLHSLDLSSVPAASATDAALVEPLRALTGLTRLSLRGCRCVTAGGLARALSGLPRLRSLDLSGCVGLLGLSASGSGGGSIGGFAAALPEGSLAALAELSADRIPWLGDGDVEALAGALRPPVSSPCFSSSSPRGLVKLSLDGAGKLTGKGLAALSGTCSNLERLSLAGCSSLDDAGLSAGLAPFAGSLTALVLDRCARFTGSGLAGAAPGHCFPALRHLSARDSGVDDAGAAAAASSSGGECRFPALEELVLDDCSALTDYGVEALAGNRATAAAAAAAATRAEAGIAAVGLPSLARLSLARLPRLEGWGLSPLFGSSPGLASLCLAGCVRLGDSAAQAVGERGARLEDLDVSDCERVGVGFCSLLRDAPLVRLRASRCPRLSPAAVEALGSSGGRARETLEELEVSGCAALAGAAGGDDATGASGGGAAAVAAALPNLRSLDLSATPLTRRGLEELLLLVTSADGGVERTPRLPRLAALNLACCPRLSRPAVQRLLLLLLASSASGGGGGGLRVNSWGCKEEEEDGGEKGEGEEEEEERPSIAVNSNSSSHAPVLSFGHLSPQRGNRAAAAALTAAA